VRVYLSKVYKKYNEKTILSFQIMINHFRVKFAKANNTLCFGRTTTKNAPEDKLVLGCFLDLGFAVFAGCVHKRLQPKKKRFGK